MKAKFSIVVSLTAIAISFYTTFFSPWATWSHMHAPPIANEVKWSDGADLPDPLGVRSNFGITTVHPDLFAGQRSGLAEYSDTGLYRQSAGVLAVSNNGTAYLTVGPHGIGGRSVGGEIPWSLLAVDAYWIGEVITDSFGVSRAEPLHCMSLCR